MNAIDIDNLELARYAIIIDDVDGTISVEGSHRNPDTTKNNGYLEVLIKNKASGAVVATAIMHFRELQAVMDSLTE